ncbi:MAG TPA: DUF5985 family protein [Acidobacteriaceae bacterium]|nr:DUF5985 family protein [Acidobacteriaceae bacterium]
MAAAVYILGMCVALLCGALLARGYRQSRHRLLLWSAICFVGLGITNALVFVDLFMLPSVDLHLLRRIVAGISMLILVYGLIWDSE